MAPQTQTRVVVTSFDPANLLDTLAVETHAPVPAPAAGEILVRVTARPVNPADVFSIMGVYPGFTPASLPAVPGLEGVGVVADANGCATVKEGDRGVVFVDAKGGQGSWQEYVAVSAANFLPVPPSVSDETASQFLVNPVTVVGMLQELAVPSGAFILQSAAGSTLGRMLITVAKHRGIKTINLVRRAEQIPELLAAGADHVICTSEDVGARVQEITGGKGAWGAVDAVGGELTAVITGALRPGGTVLVYGAMSGMVFTGSIVDVLFRGVSIKGFWLTPYLESLSADAKKAVFSEIVTMFAEGLLVPFSGQKFQLSDVKKAVAHAQEPARGGKALLVSS